MKLSLLLSLLFTLNALADGGIDGLFQGSNNLTDEERVQANDYVHTARIDALIQEECGKHDVTKEFGCGEDSVEQAGEAFKGAAAVEAMIPQLYSTLGMLSSLGGGGQAGGQTGGIQMRPKKEAVEAASAKGEKAKGESKQDLCIMIPIAGEMGLKMAQGIQEQNIINSPINQEDLQRESLLKVARIHDARAKTATGQSVVYGTTTACYGAYLAAGAQIDPGMAIKIAASGGLTALFAIKAEKHKKYKKALEYIASKIPGKGDCNPHTQTNCFCNEPTSQQFDPANHQKVCIPKEYENRKEKNPTPCYTSSANGIPKIDLACKCKLNNSCFHHDLGEMMLSMGLGNNYMQDALAGLGLLGNGEFDQAKMNGFSAKYNAIGKKMMNQKVVGDIPQLPKVEGNVGAEEFKKLGMSPALANLAANSRPAGAPGTGAMPTSSPSFRPSSFMNDIKGNSQDFKMKANIGSSSGGSRRKQNDFNNPFAKKEKGAVGGVQEIGFLEEKAMREADITKNADSVIFDIITYRYQRSGVQKLKIEPTPTSSN